MNTRGALRERSSGEGLRRPARVVSIYLGVRASGTRCLRQRFVSTARGAGRAGPGARATIGALSGAARTPCARARARSPLPLRREPSCASRGVRSAAVAATVAQPRSDAAAAAAFLVGGDVAGAKPRLGGATHGRCERREWRVNGGGGRGSNRRPRFSAAPGHGYRILVVGAFPSCHGACRHSCSCRLSLRIRQRQVR